MLGLRVRASQTRGLFPLYGAEVGKVHEPQRRRLALSFLWVRELCFHYYRDQAVPKGHCFSLRKFSRESPNPSPPVRCLLSMDIP